MKKMFPVKTICYGFSSHDHSYKPPSPHRLRADSLASTKGDQMLAMMVPVCNLLYPGS